MSRPGFEKKPRKTFKEIAERRVFNSFKANARGREFTLAYALVARLIYKNCHYCDSPPKNSMKLHTPGWEGCVLNYSGLDRKDNNKGYIKSNVVPCCAKCNSIKGNQLAYEEMVALSDFLKSMLKKAQSKQAAKPAAQRASTRPQKTKTQK